MRFLSILDQFLLFRIFIYCLIIILTIFRFVVKELELNKVLLAHIEMIGSEIIFEELPPLSFDKGLFFYSIFKQDILIKTLFIKFFMELDRQLIQILHNPVHLWTPSLNSIWSRFSYTYCKWLDTTGR